MRKKCSTARKSWSCKGRSEKVSILLQKKYSRVIECFARQQSISLNAALDFFYRSEVYQLVRDGVSDMHCMSDAYLAEELALEYKEKQVPVSEV